MKPNFLVQQFFAKVINFLLNLGQSYLAEKKNLICSPEKKKQKNSIHLFIFPKDK